MKIFQDTESLGAFLQAALRSPKLRGRLLQAIEADPELRGAAELHAAVDREESAALTPLVMEFVETMESGNQESQQRAAEAVIDNPKLFREIYQRGFGVDWIAEKMGI